MQVDPAEPLSLAGLDDKVYGASQVSGGSVSRLKLLYGNIRPVFRPWKPPTTLSGALLNCKLDIAKNLLHNSAVNEAKAVESFVMGTVLFVCVAPHLPPPARRHTSSLLPSRERSRPARSRPTHES